MLRPETEFILRLDTLPCWCAKLNKRLSHEDFLEFLDVIFEEGPLVKYQNPDAWGQPLHQTV